MKNSTARVLYSMFILAASLVLSTLAEADPLVPRPFPCGMATTPKGLKLVSIGGTGPYLRSAAIFPVWINSVGGPSGAVCTEVHAISKQNIYEISMLRYHPKGNPRANCQKAQLRDEATSFTYHLSPGDWAAVTYDWPGGELGIEAVYVPRPGEYSLDSGISACVKITKQMNETPDQLSGTLDPFAN
jgi:hypothetical protein